MTSSTISRLDQTQRSSMLQSDISSWKNYAALAYILTAAAPALFIAPLFLSIILFLGLCEFVYGRNPAGKSPTTLPTIILFFYIIGSATITGIPLQSLFSYHSVRYDSNIFYSMLPLLFLGSGHLSLRKMDFIIALTSIIGSISYIALPYIGIYTFESHNAAGGYLMILLAYLIGRSMTNGFRGRKIAICIAIMALILSDSRGSILALIASVSAILMFKKFPRLTLTTIFFSVSTLIVTLTFSYSWWVENGSLFLYDYADFGPATEQIPLDQFLIGERPGTVLHRALFLFPMAVEMFLQSPISGIGFTRFNDFPLDIQGWSGIVALNFSDAISFSNLHAHNSYLHLAAEIGLIGLWLTFRVIRSTCTGFVKTPDLLTTAAMILGSLLIASFTEHRLTTPSQGAPAFIIINLLWACRNSNPNCSVRLKNYPKGTPCY